MGQSFGGFEQCPTGSWLKPRKTANWNNPNKRDNQPWHNSQQGHNTFASLGQEDEAEDGNNGPPYDAAGDATKALQQIRRAK